MWGLEGGSREAGGGQGHVRGGSRNNGGAGGVASGEGSPPSPGVSSPCLTHPHGDNGGGGAQLLLPTLAGWEAAVAATLERRRAPHCACASRAPQGAPAGTAPAQSPTKGRAGEGAQVESLGGGPRVSHTTKRREARSKRRARNDVSPSPPPSPQAVSVAMATASARGEARDWATRWVAAQPLRWPLRLLRLNLVIRGAATFKPTKRVTASEIPAPPTTLGHRRGVWNISHLLDREL